MARCTVRLVAYLELRAMVLTADLGALNWATGETVAVKEIQLSNIPKSEIGQIMASCEVLQSFPLAYSEVIQSEIDLLKNLNVRSSRFITRNAR